MDILGLTEDELCTVLDSDALTLLSGQLEHSTELPILLDLLAGARERVTPGALRSWLRSASAAGGRRPLDLLLARDFAAFEDALDELTARGFVIRRPGA